MDMSSMRMEKGIDNLKGGNELCITLNYTF